MIPKTVHYCWFGEKPLTDLNKRCIDSWARVLPDFTIKRWDESNTVFDNNYLKYAFASRSWSRLSNLIRLDALRREGGIYVDTDVEMVKALGPFLTHRCFVGFQQKVQQADWINSAIVGSEAGHPFIAKCIDLTLSSFDNTGEFPRSPSVFTEVLLSMGLREYKQQEIDGVALYPSDYFYPFTWLEHFSPDRITENTYCIHHWEGSWLSRKHRRIRTVRRTLKRLFPNW
jgi:mannosyltransferase OCH1-like enzyme